MSSDSQWICDRQEIIVCIPSATRNPTECISALQWIGSSVVRCTAHVPIGVGPSRDRHRVRIVRKAPPSRGRCAKTSNQSGALVELVVLLLNLVAFGIGDGCGPAPISQSCLAAELVTLAGYLAC